MWWKWGKTMIKKSKTPRVKTSVDKDYRQTFGESIKTAHQKSKHPTSCEKCHNVFIGIFCPCCNCPDCNKKFDESVEKLRTNLRADKEKTNREKWAELNRYKNHHPNRLYNRCEKCTNGKKKCINCLNFFVGGVCPRCEKP